MTNEVQRIVDGLALEQLYACNIRSAGAKQICLII